MKVIWSRRSTNGRWGAEIVSGAPELPEASGSICDPHCQWPMRGHLKPLGRRGGVEAFCFTPDESASTWVWPTDDAEPIEGATVAYRESLQSSSTATIFVLGSPAIVQSYGYKRRSSRFNLVREGRVENAPASVLLALGLIEPEEEAAPIEPPPAPSTALADALRRAGYGS